MKSNKVFLNLKHVRVITLVKFLMKIILDLKCSINMEETIYNFSSDNIKNPRDYHIITTSLSTKKKIGSCWVRNATIHKTDPYPMQWEP